jgi:membrane protease YdiL (CAAX protease family)
MTAELKSLIAGVANDGRSVSLQARKGDGSASTLAIDSSGPLQVGLVFGLIMLAVWTPPGRANAISTLLAAMSTVWFTVRGGYSIRELGLARPVSGALVMLVSGVFMVMTMIVAGSVIHSLGPARPVPWDRAWKYAIWALLQEFILQSFFYVRLESLFGSRRAVWGAALLFCVAHLPSPVLTFTSLIGGLLFCEMFRRYRNIFPLGFVHATIGLTIAASLPDNLLHHMRVGLGYLS